MRKVEGCNVMFAKILRVQEYGNTEEEMIQINGGIKLLVLPVGWNKNKDKIKKNAPGLDKLQKV